MKKIRSSKRLLTLVTPIIAASMVLPVNTYAGEEVKQGVEENIENSLENSIENPEDKVLSDDISSTIEESQQEVLNLKEESQSEVINSKKEAQPDAINLKDESQVSSNNGDSKTETVQYIYYKDGVKTPGTVEANIIDKESKLELGNADEDTWYVVKGDVNIRRSINLQGNVHLILADDCKLTVNDIYTDQSLGKLYDFNIYGQEKNTGELISNDSDTEIIGHLTINGGKVSTSKSISINKSEITINGGEVKVGKYIWSDNDITINGGKVTVDSHIVSEAGDITVNGGEVISGSDSLSKGYVDNDGYITAENLIVNGGKVTAGSYIHAVNDMTIESGEVESCGKDEGEISADNNLTIKGGKVTAATYILANDITIEGGEVESCGKVAKDDGNITARNNLTIKGGELTSNDGIYAENDIIIENATIDVNKTIFNYDNPQYAIGSYSECKLSVKDATLTINIGISDDYDNNDKEVGVFRATSDEGLLIDNSIVKINYAVPASINRDGTIKVNKSIVYINGVLDDEVPSTDSIIFYNEEGVVSGSATLIDNLNIPDPVTLNIGEDASLTIPKDIQLTNNGTINNDGKLHNKGSILNVGTMGNAGTINNSGDFANTGTLVNADALGGSGTINNDGSITNDGSIINKGKFITSTEDIVLNNVSDGKKATYLYTGKLGSEYILGTDYLYSKLSDLSDKIDLADTIDINGKEFAIDKAKWNKTFTKQDGDNWVDTDNVTDAGNYRVTFTDKDDENNSFSKDFTVSGIFNISNVDFGREFDTYTYTYGETIRVTVAPNIKSLSPNSTPLMQMSLANNTNLQPETFAQELYAKDIASLEDGSNKMALFVGDKQISDAVLPDEEGKYVLTYNTTDKDLDIGKNTISIRYAGNKESGNGRDVTSFDITLNKKTIDAVRLTDVESSTKVYDGNNEFKNVKVTLDTPDGKIETTMDFIVWESDVVERATFSSITWIDDVAIPNTSSKLSDYYDLDNLNRSGLNIYGVFKIIPRELSIGWSDTKLEYNGLSQVPTVSLTGVVDGEQVEATISGGQINANKDGEEYEASVNLSGYTLRNYNITGDKTTKFTIAKRPLSVSWGETTFTYDGESHIPTVEVKGILENDSAVKYSVSGKQVNAGNHTARVVLSGDKSENYTFAGGADTTNFSIAKRPISISWGTTEFTYTGEAHTPSATVNEDDIVKGDGVNVVVEVEGEHTKPGSYIAKAKLDNDNYTIADDATTSAEYTIKNVDNPASNKPSSTSDANNTTTNNTPNTGDTTSSIWYTALSAVGIVGLVALLKRKKNK